ncbi:Chitinase 2 [Entomophthora muscae]|uniref:Chitinase 2 n=1 Tax=Entomophthora muscae TaxID=34485 RepID=A0ACC2TB64_9FUNG|nr:Chitinase 2 [Entomophthora muscae]
MFLGGTHDHRPFGTAILDGIDLDIEGGSQAFYSDFLEMLRKLFSASGRKYFGTAAPQCKFPDRNLQQIIDSAYIDAVFIQFYNNHCGVHNYHNKASWNWGTWEDWASKKPNNSNVKLFLGLPASQSAASFGYIPPTQVSTILADISKSPRFGGVMFWDASQNQNNPIQGKSFSQHIQDSLTPHHPASKNTHQEYSNLFSKPTLLAQEASSQMISPHMYLFATLLYLFWPNIFI